MSKSWKTSVTPGFGDADPLRHINNTMLPIWFELAREPIFRLIHPTLDYDTWPLILARIQVDFVAQMKFGQPVEIHTYIKKLGRSSFTVYQEAYQLGVLGVKGECILVHFDYRTQKSCPIPPAIAAELAEYLIDPENPNLRTRSGRFA